MPMSFLTCVISCDTHSSPMRYMNVLSSFNRQHLRREEVEKISRGCEIRMRQAEEVSQNPPPPPPIFSSSHNLWDLGLLCTSESVISCFRVVVSCLNGCTEWCFLFLLKANEQTTSWLLETMASLRFPSSLQNVFGVRASTLDYFR